MPDIATQKSKQKTKWVFVTKELSALNDRMNESLTDIFSMTNCEVQVTTPELSKSAKQKLPLPSEHVKRGCCPALAMKSAAA